MAQTLTSLLVHVVFSTKNREPMIPDSLEREMYAYVGGVCRACDCVLHAAGGTCDHVHLLVSLSKTVTLADLMRHIKSGSSAWMNERMDGRFRWQEGYSGFSIGQSQRERVRRYIDRQKEHHAHMTFQDELLALLRRYEVEFDERYVWT